MCRDPVYGKKLRILKPRKLRFFCCHISVTPLFLSKLSLYRACHSCHKLFLHQEEDQCCRDCRDHNRHHHHTIIWRIRGTHCGKNQRQSSLFRRLQCDQRPQIIIPARHERGHDGRRIAGLHGRHKDFDFIR